MFMKSIWIAFIGVMLFVAGASAANPVLQGMVKDAKGRPIQGADVRIEAPDTGKLIATVKTNLNGRYNLESLAAGNYRVWVRTRDWVAPWKANGAPGRFRLVIDGTPLATTFGTEGADWHWQDGGTIRVPAQAKVALHDLTGFEGRCDAILFCSSTSFVPPERLGELAQLRSELLGWAKEPLDGGTYDLVVVGGGIAGTCAALSACSRATGRRCSFRRRSVPTS